MNKTQERKLKKLAGELAKDIKTGEDLSSLSTELVKLTTEEQRWERRTLSFLESKSREQNSVQKPLHHCRYRTPPNRSNSKSLILVNL